MIGEDDFYLFILTHTNNCIPPSNKRHFDKVTKNH